MVLLDLVIRNHPKEKIIVAHFDHSLRGEESDGDRELVANYCKRENIVFEVQKMDIAFLSETEKTSIEASARKYRYEFLFRVKEQYGAKYILTAHHQDDRIETALFNLIRGTKLGGIHALSESTLPLLRPLLRVPKTKILAYARESKISFHEDSSNTDTMYLRNHLRHNILPEFEKINSEYRRALENFIDYTSELKTWIDEEIQVFLMEWESFPVSLFEKKSIFFQKEIIRYFYEKAHHGTIWLSEGNIDEFLRFILTANGGTTKEIGKLRLEKRKWNIYFSFLPSSLDTI